jgi:hypothetical protein
MSFESSGGGITKLSQLLIDADKNWQTKGISNLKELALGMIQGDLVVRGGGGVLVRLPAGVANLVLTSGGPGVIPSWQPGGTYYSRYFPANIGLSKTVVSGTPDQSIVKNAPLTSPYEVAYLDAPADYISRLTPSFTSAKSVSAIALADQSIAKNGPFTRNLGLQQIIDGAVADDGGVETDETAAAQSGAANDMTLLPAAPAVGDAYMLGSRYKAHCFPINIGIAGAGNWTLVMKYWNGAWTNCVDEVETSAQFMSSGLKYWQHSPQGDWVTHVVQGMDLYWVRIEVTNFVNIVTQPKGTQSWWEYLL